MLDILSGLRAAAAVLLVGNLLIVCHELGHFLAARCLRVRVLRFTIGFGPVLARPKDAKGTIWTLPLLPIGGYVGFEGEKMPSTRDHTPPGRPWLGWIIVAGPAANIGVAIVVFALLLAVVGAPGFLPVARTVVAGSAADRAGFHVGDRVRRPNWCYAGRFRLARRPFAPVPVSLCSPRCSY